MPNGSPTGNIKISAPIIILPDEILSVFIFIKSTKKTNDAKRQIVKITKIGPEIAITNGLIVNSLPHFWHFFVP